MLLTFFMSCCQYPLKSFLHIWIMVSFRILSWSENTSCQTTITLKVHYRTKSLLEYHKMRIKILSSYRRLLFALHFTILPAVCFFWGSAVIIPISLFIYKDSSNLNFPVILCFSMKSNISELLALKYYLSINSKL